MSISMDEIVIAGIGQITVGEHWELSLRSIAAIWKGWKHSPPKPQKPRARPP